MDSSFCFNEGNLIIENESLIILDLVWSNLTSFDRELGEIGKYSDG